MLSKVRKKFMRNEAYEVRKKRTRLFPSIEQSVRKQKSMIFNSFVPDAIDGDD